VTIWMLLWIPVLALGLGAIVDYGAAIGTRAFASDAAFGAARAGAVHLVAVTGQGAALDQPDAETAALVYIDQVERPPRVELAATVTTTPTAVTVTVTASYQPRLITGMASTFTRTETAEVQLGQ
jgi:Flp pilus assembly protein TadG